MFSRVHKRCQTPHVSTWLAGLAVGVPAGVWDIGTFADLSNIGTLFAFIIVSVGVVVLRRTQPERVRACRVPLFTGDAGDFGSELSGVDVGIASRDMDSVFCVAGDWAGDLLVLRAEAESVV
jgi:hypothetical protein